MIKKDPFKNVLDWTKILKFATINGKDTLICKQNRENKRRKAPRILRVPGINCCDKLQNKLYRDFYHDN